MRIPLVRACIALAAALALSLAGRPAQAQQVGAPDKTVAAVRGGAYFPFNSTAKDRIGKTWYGGGLDYTFQQKQGLSRSLISLDYIERSSGGNTIRLIPVTFGQFTLQANGGSQSNIHPYFGVGVGVYFVHQTVPDDTGLVHTNNATSLGGYLAAGLDLPANLMIEARYHILEKVGGINDGGLQVMGGFRF